ncbi:MAG TPA: hypothetical protein VHV79_00190 [Mycobacteriales bacterium]|nr:hypothetical protein [Mycobacteriales bacterium]
MARIDSHWQEVSLLGMEIGAEQVNFLQRFGVFSVAERGQCEGVVAGRTRVRP